MAGVGQSDEPLVSAGLAAQPLVTNPDPNIVSSAAVDNLVSAYHKGFLTQDDIVSRIGEVAQAKKKSLLTEMEDYVSPEARTARLAAHKAMAAQADLTTEQAHAAQGLVNAQAEFSNLKLGMDTANLSTSNGVAAYQQLAAVYGLPPSIMQPDGKTLDLQEMGRLGNVLVAHDYNLRYGVPDPEKKPITYKAGGQDFVQQFNRHGLPITEQGRQASQDALGRTTPVIHAAQLLHPIGGQRVGTPNQVNSLVTPTTAAPTEESAADTQLVTPTSTPATVAPKTGVVLPKYERPFVPQAGTYVRGLQVATEPDPKDVESDLHKTNEHQEWSKQLGRVLVFDRLKTKENNPINARALASQVSGLMTANPSGMDRSSEARWKDLMEKQPWLLDPSGTIPVAIHKKGVLDRVWNELTDLGENIVKTNEALVFPSLVQAVNKIPSAYPPTKVLNKREEDIYERGIRGEFDATPSDLVRQGDMTPSATAKKVPNQPIVTNKGTFVWRPELNKFEVVK